MKQTVIYARFSSDNQRKESIDEQIRACKYYAQQTGGHEIVGIYSDEAMSGYKHTSKRAGFNQLMEDARAHKFECVLVWELSRFSRNGKDTIIYTDELERLGIELISMREKLDRTPEGRMMMYVITGMNEYFSANLAIEVMRGLKENAYNAKHTGGLPPLGYDVDKDGHYVINPIEAAAVRLIYDMYLDGSGYTPIIDALNSRGYKTKRGGKFAKNSLYDLLRNEKYTGTFVYNRTASEKNGKQNRHKYKDNSEVIRVEDAFPAIITKEEYERVLKRMEENKHKGAAFKAKYDYMLSGKVYCGHCNRSMHGETRPRRGVDYAYYMCPNQKLHQCEKRGVRADKLEAEVIRQLNEIYFTSELMDKVAERLHSEDGSRRAEEAAAMLRKQSAELQRKINNGTKVLMDGFDNEDLRKAVEECSAQKRAIDRRIVEIEAAADQNGRTVREIRENISQYMDISKLPRDEQKKIIQKFVWRIYVYNDDTSPDDKIKIVLASTEQARAELDAMAGDYVALTDFLSDMSGNALPLPIYWQILPQKSL